MVKPRHIGYLLGYLLILAASLSANAVVAQAPMPTGMHDFRANLPAGCMPGEYDTGASPADVMQRFAAELNITGQQQQDIRILTADYGQRLRDLAQLGRRSAERLLGTEPGADNYWTIAQEVSASAAASAAETVILLSELREKLSAVLTVQQRAELRRLIEERKAACTPESTAEQ